MRSLRLTLLAAVVLATAALAWNHEYSWYEFAAPTANVKPGGGGVFGTGSQYEGGIQCTHCHTPVLHNQADPLRVLVTFTPPMTGAPTWDGGVDGFRVAAGQYAPNTTYAVNVRMLNEHLLRGDGGIYNNNFAAIFEDSNGVPVGAMTTDTGIDAGNCPANSVAGMGPTTGTTHMYRKCDVMFSRYPGSPTMNGFSSWNFTWRSPPSSAGVVTMAVGVVDGNGDDRTRNKDAGASDDVVMGKLTLSP